MDNDMSAAEALELQKKNCIFCKIISREIPSTEIYSDDKVFVILDINPANEGHCLLLPKEHYQILPQMPDELIGYMFKTAKNMSRTLLKSLGIKGTTIFVANGALAGQKAPHFMMHVIPRRRNDMLFNIPKGMADEKQLFEIRERLARKLGFSKQPEPKHEIKAHEEKKSEDKPDKIDLDKISGLFG